MEQQNWIELPVETAFYIGRDIMKAKLVNVKDSSDATLVNDDSSSKAHKVILVAISSFFSNFVIIPSIKRVSYPNDINYYTLTQGHCTERLFE